MFDSPFSDCLFFHINSVISKQCHPSQSPRQTEWDKCAKDMCDRGMIFPEVITTWKFSECPPGLWDFQPKEMQIRFAEVTIIKKKRISKLVHYFFKKRITFLTCKISSLFPQNVDSTSKVVLLGHDISMKKGKSPLLKLTTFGDIKRIVIKLYWRGHILNACTARH